MKAAVLTALKGSITKWKKIVAGTGTDNGTTNCPLCAMFYNQIESCIGCPVSKKTGIGDCRNTPWPDWAFSHDGVFPYTVENEDQKKFAKKELAFLQALLPKKKKTIKKAKKRL